MAEGAEGEQAARIEEVADAVHGSLDLERGPLLRVVLLERGTARTARLLLVAHHLVVDVLSWHILLEDLQAAYEALCHGMAPELPPRTASFRRWAERLAGHARSAEVRRDLGYWLTAARVRPLPVEKTGPNTVASVRAASASLDVAETRRLLQEVPRVYHTGIEDLLLTALAQAVAAWTGERQVLAWLESHGRGDLFPEVDLTRTVGWLSIEYPVLLDLGGLGGAGGPTDALLAVRDQLRAVPGGGLSYGLLRYGGDPDTGTELAALPQAEIVFNYFGQIDRGLGGDSAFVLAPEPEGSVLSPRGHRSFLLEVNGWVAAGRLELTLLYSRNVHRQQTADALIRDMAVRLRELIAACLAGEVRYTPADFTRVSLTREDLDNLLAELGEPVE
jgi:non-ribosomal peptide synthase protein (TIGR01720 family)